MKRILSSLFFIAMLVISAANLEAAKKDNDSNSNKRYMMSSQENTKPAAYKFVIDGYVSVDIPDSCYNIYITDIDKEITDQDFVACVPVKNKKFRFEVDLEVIKAGRLRAILPGDKLCSAWIDIYFIPGFTVNLTVNNGNYDINNVSEYNFMVNAWLNKEALSALYGGAGSSSDATINKEVNEMEIAIQQYKELLRVLQEQVLDVNRLPYNMSDEIVKIYKRMDQINAKMEAIIDKYAAKIKY